MRGIEKRIAALEEKVGMKTIPPRAIRVVFEGLPQSHDLIFHIGDEQMRGQVDIPDDKE